MVHHFLAKFSLSHGVIRFVASVSSENHLSGWLKFFTGQSEASIQWLLKLTLATKRSTPCERVWETVPWNGVFSCVPFCLRSLERFARCALFISQNLISFIAYNVAKLCINCKYKQLVAAKKFQGREPYYLLQREGERKEVWLTAVTCFNPKTFNIDPDIEFCHIAFAVTLHFLIQS